MNNGDMPAMPTNPVESIGNTTITRSYVEGGLTKREHFAGLAMQGLLSNPNIVNRGGTHKDCDLVRVMAISYANNLLEGLEELDK